MENIVAMLDQNLIILYQLTNYPVVNFFLGTFLLAVLSVIVGEITIYFAYKVNIKFIRQNNQELTSAYNLSMKAMELGDKNAYQSTNKLANDAFGKSFFSMIALSAALYWPVFFSLAWMQLRFISIELPLPLSIPILGKSTSFIFPFILCYILSSLLFRALKTSFKIFKIEA